jgi:sulfopyruvate decarboxylase subunit beta
MSMQPLAALRTIAELRADAIVVPTMTTVAPWHEISPSALNVSCIGFMGGASALGLGLALAQPERRVIVLDGDGSLLMQLGSLATIAGAAPPNFYHVVFKNGIYHVSGGQPVPAAATLDFAAMARAAGYRQAHHFADLESFRTALPTIFAEAGPALIELETEPIPTARQGSVGNASFAAEAEAARRALLVG